MKLSVFVTLILVCTLLAQPPVNISELDARIKAVCPLDGVSVRKLTDKSTWRIDFAPAATAPQRAAAQSIIDNWTAADWDGTPAVKKAAALQKILDLHTKRAALTIERDYQQSQGAAARVTALQALLDAAQTQIDALRPQS